MTARRIRRMVVATALALGVIAVTAPGDAQTAPRCTSHVDAQHFGYHYCGTDQIPR